MKIMIKYKRQLENFSNVFVMEGFTMKIKWTVKHNTKKTVNSFGCFKHCETMRNS